MAIFNSYVSHNQWVNHQILGQESPSPQPTGTAHAHAHALNRALRRLVCGSNTQSKALERWRGGTSPRKSWVFIGKTMGKPCENHGKTMGKPMENGGLMDFEPTNGGRCPKHKINVPNGFLTIFKYSGSWCHRCSSKAIYTNPQKQALEKNTSRTIYDHTAWKIIHVFFPTPTDCHYQKIGLSLFPP